MVRMKTYKNARPLRESPEIVSLLVELLLALGANKNPLFMFVRGSRSFSVSKADHATLMEWRIQADGTGKWGFVGFSNAFRDKILKEIAWRQGERPRRPSFLPGAWLLGSKNFRP